MKNIYIYYLNIFNLLFIKYIIKYFYLYIFNNNENQSINFSNFNKDNSFYKRSNTFKL
jgi:hypothetical protein